MAMHMGILVTMHMEELVTVVIVSNGVKICFVVSDTL
jgi:hypothetical protein